MAAQDKIVLINRVNDILRSKMFADKLDEALEEIGDMLNDFDITLIEFENDLNEGDYLSVFLTAKRVEGKSEKTLDRYGYVISRFMKYAKTPTKEITILHLRQYFSDEKERGVSDNTLEGVRQILNGYFGWLMKERMIKINPMENFGKIKVPKKTRAAYTKPEIERLKRNAKTNRDLAIICFLLSTGCRISELTNANRSDVNFSKLECLVCGKGNKERTVYFDEITAMYLKEYLDSRVDDFEALFIGKGTTRLHPGGVRFMLNKLGAISNVDHTHPHKFRRTLCTNLINLGMPIHNVASILGHDKIDTTMKYVVMNQSTVKNEYQKFQVS